VSVTLWWLAASRGEVGQFTVGTSRCKAERRELEPAHAEDLSIEDATSAAKQATQCGLPPEAPRAGEGLASSGLCPSVPRSRHSSRSAHIRALSSVILGGTVGFRLMCVQV
jgi:hypothetical protein